MKPRIALSLGNFFAAGHFFLALTILAPYLSQYIQEAHTALVVAAGALLSLIAFPYVPALIRAYGVRAITLAYLALSGISLAILSFSASPIAAVICIALFCAYQPIIGYLLDLLLESTISSETETGRIRTLFLTCGNIALLFAPIIIGAVLGDGNNYEMIFIIAAASVVAAVLVLAQVRPTDTGTPVVSKFKDVIHCLAGDRDIQAVAIAFGVLQFMYNLAPFFVPLYLHNHLGIPWSQLGPIFAIMLIPFVVLEYPVGYLADRYFGDREMMALGLLIMGTAFATTAFIVPGTPLVAIMLILLITRIGAAVAEATIESHFFRRVSSRDTSSVAVFRMIRPTAALVAPLLGAVILMTSSYSVLFFSTGILIIIFGVASALSIKDIR